MSSRGFVLPFVLLVLVALSGVAVVALLVARTEVALEPGDFRYLEERARWGWLLENPPDPWGEGEGGSPGELLRPLPEGFALVRSRVGAGPAYHGVVWLLDPDRAAEALPPAAEVGWGVPDSGVEWGGPGCGDTESAFLVRTRSPPPPEASDPAPDPPPRLGPSGIPTLLPRARLIEPTEPSSFPVDPGTVTTAPVGSRLEAGEGKGLLLVSGDLTLSGSHRWTGVVMVLGNLDLEGDAYLEGVALVGGRLRIRDDARLAGCPARATQALAAPELRRPFLVPGGQHLGRF